MKQKVWFITGASKGIGREIAKTALNVGDKVIAAIRGDITNLNLPTLEDNQLLVVQVDITDEAQARLGVQKGMEQFVRIDVLVNNARYGLLAATEEASDHEVRKQFETNVFGLLNVTRSVLPFMRQQRSRHIINISSLFGYKASVPGFGIYGSTKFAVEGISEGRHLVRCVCPNKNGFSYLNVTRRILQSILNWTGSKTSLIELIYVQGALDNQVRLQMHLSKRWLNRKSNRLQFS